MLDSSRLASEMADRMISELGIPEQAREKFRLWAFILADSIINHFKANAEINLDNVQIQIQEVMHGDIDKTAQKQGRGSIE